MKVVILPECKRPAKCLDLLRKVCSIEADYDEQRVAEIDQFPATRLSRDLPRRVTDALCGADLSSSASQGTLLCKPSH